MAETNSLMERTISRGDAETGFIEYLAGFYITGEEYPSPSFERALNLHGQEERNSNAFARRIVFHGADYLNEEAGVVGRSWGCPADDRKHAFRLIDQLKDASLFYIVNEREPK